MPLFGTLSGTCVEPWNLLSVEPLWNLEPFKCGTFVRNLGEPGARFPAAAPNHRKALLARPQVFQAVGEKFSKKVQDQNSQIHSLIRLKRLQGLFGARHLLRRLHLRTPCGLPWHILTEELACHACLCPHAKTTGQNMSLRKNRHEKIKLTHSQPLLENNSRSFRCPAFVVQAASEHPMRLALSCSHKRTCLPRYLTLDLTLKPKVKTCQC